MYFFSVILAAILIGHEVQSQSQNSSESLYKQRIREAQCLVQCFKSCNASFPTFNQLTRLVEGSKCPGNITACDINDNRIRLCVLPQTEVDEFDKNLVSTVPSPSYHCTSRSVGALTYDVYFRFEYIKSGTTTKKYLSELPKNLIPIAFVVEIETNNGSWTFDSIRSDWLVPLKLTPGNDYRVRITPISKRTVYQPQVSDVFHIYHIHQLEPKLPRNLTMERVDGEPTRVRGSTRNFRFYFESSSGSNASCSHEYALGAVNSSKDVLRSTKADEAFRIGFQSFLPFDSSQTVFVRESIAANYEVNHLARPNSPLTESFFNKTFKIPSCFKFHNYSFKECPPPPPIGLEVRRTSSDLSLKINWHPPKYTSPTNPINNYILWICKAKQQQHGNESCHLCFAAKQYVWKYGYSGLITDIEVEGNAKFNVTENLLVCLFAITEAGISKTVHAVSKGSEIIPSPNPKPDTPEIIPSPIPKPDTPEIIPSPNPKPDTATAPGTAAGLPVTQSHFIILAFFSTFCVLLLL